MYCKERKNNGNYISFEDFVSRVNLKSNRKRTLESVSLSGGFDSFDIFRSQLFYRGFCKLFGENDEIWNYVQAKEIQLKLICLVK